MFGWIGNVFVVIGLYGVGDKNRNALWFSIAGECCYIIHCFLVKDWAIFAAAWIFLFMVVRAYVKWGKDDSVVDSSVRSVSSSTSPLDRSTVHI